MAKGHAVRWARRKVRGELQYGRWHATSDGRYTACNWSIPLGLPGTFLPETDEDLSRVDCTFCVLAARRALREGVVTAEQE
jgi:hypothetical protein